jgi:hypothetical protein
VYADNDSDTESVQSLYSTASARTWRVNPVYRTLPTPMSARRRALAAINQLRNMSRKSLITEETNNLDDINTGVSRTPVVSTLSSKCLTCPICVFADSGNGPASVNGDYGSGRNYVRSPYDQVGGGYGLPGEGRDDAVGRSGSATPVIDEEARCVNRFDSFTQCAYIHV